MKLAFALACGLFAPVATPAVDEAPGYGPWRLGMSREEVAAVASHGPYANVPATGGLETANGEFRGRRVTASFVFGPDGLRHIQLWAYTGEELEAALAAFHGVYLYLADELGPLHSDGAPIPAGLGPTELEALIPPHFKTGTRDAQLDELPQRGSIQAQVHTFHLHPRTPPERVNVYGSLIHSPQLGLYWVFVYCKSL